MTNRLPPHPYQWPSSPSAGPAALPWSGSSSIGRVDSLSSRRTHPHAVSVVERYEGKTNAEVKIPAIIEEKASCQAHQRRRGHTSG